MTDDDDNLFGDAVQRVTGLAESGIKHETRQLLGTEDDDDKKRRRRMASTAPDQSPVGILGTPAGGF